MIKFIFFGRLVQEKWIDTIIDAFSRLHKEWVTNWHIEIYGEWPLFINCQEFAQNFPRNVLLHWRTSQVTIYDNLKSVHYCMMPSKVIESFWMSALESLSMGVPVIGRKIGGLEQFIEQTYDCESTSLYHILKNTLTTFSLETRKKESQKVQEKAANYNKQHRLEKVQQLWNCKNVLIVSDYTSKIWGIETIVATNKKVLESIWSNVALVWWHIWKKHMGIKRKIGLLATALNIPMYVTIKHKICTQKPTIIRLNSLSRYIGWFPLTTIPKETTTLYTVHDLGIFHPFGASVSDIGQIPQFSLHWFTSTTNNPIKKILIALKYLNLRLLRKQLIKKVDMRIVPSEFMVNILYTKRHIPQSHIKVIANFIG